MSRISYLALCAALVGDCRLRRYAGGTRVDRRPHRRRRRCADWRGGRRSPRGRHRRRPEWCCHWRSDDAAPIFPLILAGRPRSGLGL